MTEMPKGPIGWAHHYADLRGKGEHPRCVSLRAVDASLVPQTRPAEDAEQLTAALAALVRSALEQSGRSQASVAEEVHVSVRHLNRMLHGKSQLTLWWAARILRVCGMRLVVGEDGR